MGLITVVLSGAVGPFKKQTTVRSEAEREEDPVRRLIYFGCQPGKETLDAGTFTPGNPFATAFVKAFEDRNSTLSSLGDRLQEVTRAESSGFQVVDSPQVAADDKRHLWSQDGEKRVALVLVISSYADGRHLPPLEGARKDARRVAEVLLSAGYHVIRAVDLDRIAVESELQRFEKISSDSDVAVIYTTGHGLRVSGSTHLLMRDFDVSDGPAELKHRALTIRQIAKAANARMANLVFYAACRNNPLNW